TVVAVEQAVAAPFATRHLADLGARVIKIERPDGGDFARGYDAAVNGLSSHFVWLNRTKESLTLDLKRPEASMVMSRLLDRADGARSSKFRCSTRCRSGWDSLRTTPPTADRRRRGPAPITPRSRHTGHFAHVTATPSSSPCRTRASGCDSARRCSDGPSWPAM